MDEASRILPIINQFKLLTNAISECFCLFNRYYTRIYVLSSISMDLLLVRVVVGVALGVALGVVTEGVVTLGVVCDVPGAVGRGVVVTVK
jgi:hypothetical protein